MKKKLKAQYFYLVLLQLFSINFYSNEKIKVVAFEYPPIYQNEINKGLACEIVIESFKSVNIDIELSFLPVKRMILNVVEGDAVCGIGGKILFLEKNVEDKISLTNPIHYVVQTFFYDSRKYKNGFNYLNINEMKGYRIGVLNGSGIMRYLEQTKELTLVTNTIHTGTAKQLNLGRIDVWAIVDLTGIKYLNELFPNDFKYYKYTKPYNIGDVSLAFSKKLDNNNYYKKKFQEGFEIILTNGKYLKIMEKYYGSISEINPDALVEDLR